MINYHGAIRAHLCGSHWRDLFVSVLKRHPHRHSTVGLIRAPSRTSPPSCIFCLSWIQEEVYSAIFWGWSDFLTYCARWHGVIGPIYICLKHFRELINLNAFLTDCRYFILHLFWCICQMTYFNCQIPESFRSTLLHVHFCGWALNICCSGWRFVILEGIQWSFEPWYVLPLLD